jgi:hypothetical protein
MNLKTGKLWQYGSEIYTKEQFEEIAMNIRRIWRGRTIVLFLDKMSSHTCASSRRYARSLGIALRFLPTASSQHLNPLETLWRYLKGEVVSNEPTPNLERTIQNAAAHLRTLKPKQRLHYAGALSPKFWLREFLK